MPSIGIDFGTTNSLIVAYDKKKNAFSYFNFSDRGNKPEPTSSTVWYHDNIVEVGKVARDNINKFGDVEGHHFERSIKLKLGTSQHLNIFGNSVAPYSVAGTILSRLKQIALEDWQAEKTGVDMSRAVFTVPINFSGNARRDLRSAANEAGIEITTFIHEPFAAIVGYLFSKYESETTDQVIQRLNELEGKHLLTFDWGGGTLDITVVKVVNGKMMELGPAELTNVAGDKFDEDIALYAWNQFVNQYGGVYTSEFLEANRRKKWDRMLAIAEQCKHELSRRDQSDFILERVVGGNEDIDLTITRQDFERLIADALESACNRIDDALHQAGIQDIDIHRVLLTGGTCYIPAIKARMIEKFGQRVAEVRNADLAIAQGAAVIAEMGWLPFLTKDIQIALSDGSFWPIFEHDMPIAAQKSAYNSEEFSCVDSRMKRAKVIVCEGMGQVRDKNLAVLNIPILGSAKFGDELVVTAELDRNIVLTVKGHSKMAVEHGNAIRKTAEVTQLCFGLDFQGVNYE